ncbi:cubilin-like [Asterias rubens]|uniref:cubilin-like n=1 Tax=Asterias rubens TaxID=7604 RepID=UPI0014557E55|nr:cubilin-like [Asterias rubens]
MKFLHVLIVVLLVLSLHLGESESKKQRRSSSRRRPTKHHHDKVTTSTAAPTTRVETKTRKTTTAPQQPMMKHKPQFNINGPVQDAPPLAARGRRYYEREAGAATFEAPHEVGISSVRSNRMSVEEKLILLEAHNDFRGQVSPAAADMVVLDWHDGLADMAQSWADGCFFAHGGTSSGGQFGWIGQNLWAGSGTSWDVYGMVESWYNEVQDYNYNNGNCNGVCGHYTQVVWAETTFVGCALKTCPFIQGLSGWSPATILVCNYGEGGNYVGMKPYVSGAQCSQCPAGYTQCIDGELCARPDQVPDGETVDEPTETDTPDQPVEPGPGTGDNGGNSGGDNGESGPDQPTYCGGTLETKSGEIASPNWPVPYSSNLECEWIIRGKRDQTVTLEVTYMDIEAERQCGWDYLQVKPNGETGGSTKYCGNVTPSPLTSEENELRVIFKSDGSVNKGGFVASYRLNGGKAETDPVCGGIITGKKGNIKSPGYPKNYSTGLNCLWTIEVADNKRVRLTFRDFQVEDDPMCDYDKVTIRLGNERLPMVLCGNEKPNGNLISTSNRMEIHLISDGANTAKGFSAAWKAI